MTTERKKKRSKPHKKKNKIDKTMKRAKSKRFTKKKNIVNTYENTTKKETHTNTKK